MSLQSWKEEFYPITAEELKIKLLNDSNFFDKNFRDIALLKHSILKWTGLLSENLKKHALYKNKKESKIRDDFEDQLYITHESCALCVIYDEELFDYGECHYCPIKNETKKCDHDDRDTIMTPYGHFFAENDPNPMLKILQDKLSIIENDYKNNYFSIDVAKISCEELIGENYINEHNETAIKTLLQYIEELERFKKI